jgi:hypothetical protein
MKKVFGVFVALASAAQASLIVQGPVVEDVDHFSAVLLWANTGSAPDFMAVTGTNWSVDILASVPGQFVNPSVQHLTPFPGMFLSTLNSPVVPGGASPLQTDSSPHLGEVNQLNVFITADTRNADSLIHIDAIHTAAVPELNTAEMWGVGIGGFLLLAAVRLFRRARLRPA